MLFDPSVWGRSVRSIQAGVHAAINRSDRDVQKDLYNHIVCSGGTTMFRGFAERLTKEMTALAPANTKINVSAQPERMKYALIGRSITTCRGAFRSNIRVDHQGRVR